MAEVYKVLCQTTATTTSYGIAGTAGAQNVYTPSGTSAAVVSTVVICNKGSTAATYRLGISTSTAHALNEMIVDGGTVPAYDSVFLTLGITIPNGSKLLFSASSTNINICAFGVEVS